MHLMVDEVCPLTRGLRDVLELLRPTEREKQRLEILNRKVYSSKELAMKEMNEYSEAFYKEHDRMWGPKTGYVSLI